MSLIKLGMLFLIFLVGCGGISAPTNLPNQFYDSNSPLNRYVQLEKNVYYDTKLNCTCSPSSEGICLPLAYVTIDACTGFRDKYTNWYITGYGISGDKDPNRNPDALEKKYESNPDYAGEHCGRTSLQYKFFTFDNKIVNSTGWKLGQDPSHPTCVVFGVEPHVVYTLLNTQEVDRRTFGTVKH